jgi:hypothetical protein
LFPAELKDIKKIKELEKPDTIENFHFCLLLLLSIFPLFCCNNEIEKEKVTIPEKKNELTAPLSSPPTGGLVCHL